MRLDRLYPGAWRDRYGEEFDALLQERGIRPHDLIDLALGALDAHLDGARVSGRTSRTLRASIGSAAALAAGVLWVLALVSAIADGNGDAGLLPMTLAISMLVLALAAFGSRSSSHPRLVAAGLLAPVAGVVLLLGGVGMASVVGADAPVWGDLTPYAFWITGLALALAGAVVFGVIGTVVGSLPRMIASLLGAGVLIQALTIFATDHATQGPLLVFAAAAFGFSWALAGLGFWRMRPTD
jgi:hypothetical protein